MKTDVLSDKTHQSNHSGEGERAIRTVVNVGQISGTSPWQLKKIEEPNTVYNLSQKLVLLDIMQ